MADVIPLLRGILCLPLAIAAGPAPAEVREARPDGFLLRHEALSPLPPDALWRRLMDWGSWWNGAHSWSGKAANLSLTLDGGLVERWEGGFVRHAGVLLAVPGQQLRLDAPFGPLQGLALVARWDIAMKAEGTGTRVTATFRTSGTAVDKLDALATPVDQVLGEAISLLAAKP
jgi:hypothetical protein